jgi:kynurenine 3-monooxygenase
MVNEKKNVIIAGAGLVGSLWACYMAKRGHNVHVFERRADMRQEVMSAGRSINLAMSTRGWTALEKIGMKDELMKIAIPMHGRMIHQTDGTTDFQAYGKKGQSIYSISRGDLNIALMNKADESEHTTFHFNHRTRKIKTDERSLHFKNETTGAKSSIRADLIFGADGAFSVVRGQLQKTPIFNYSQQYLEHGYKELSIPPNADGTHRLEKNALHIWPRKSFMLIALPNLDGSFTVTLFLQFKGAVSFEYLNTDEEVSKFFKTYFPSALEHMPNLLREFKANPSSSLVTVRCKPWHYKNVCLMGDSAHAIVPFYGQGMNAGFQDCFILDEIIDRHKLDDWDAVFNEYTDIHADNGAAIAELALRNFIEMRDATANDNFLLRKKLELYLMEIFPGKYLSQYQMVTFSNIAYKTALHRGDMQTTYAESLIKEYPNPEDWRTSAFLEKVELWLNTQA